MLDDDFYNQPTVELARALLGCRMVRMLDGRRLEGRIVETEAYHQNGDEAAHSFRGQTPRNRVMFGPPGNLYVYFIYGMHFCMNVVSEREGEGAAVLIRALEPLAGIEVMQSLRGPKIKGAELTNGPAKACRAFGLEREHDGLGLKGPELWLEPDDDPHNRVILCGPRIGISKSVDLPWRFFLKDNPYVSKTRPGPPAGRKRK